MLLDEAQFSIGGYAFGSITDDVVILESGFDTGDDRMRDQDAQPDFSDETMFGQDFHGTRTWTLTLGVRRYRLGAWDAPVDVWDVLDGFNAAWRPDSVRLVPGARSELHYVRNGVERVVFGRGRSARLEPQDVWDHEFAVAIAQFVLGDPTVYGGEVKERTLVFGSPSRAGWRLPAVLPLRSSTRFADRPGMLDTGSAPVAFEVEFTGDSAASTPGMVLAGPGWRIALRDQLLPGQSVVVNTQTKTATLNGVPADVLTADSVIDAKLPAGRPEVVLLMDTPTGATATVRWRPGYRSI